MSVGIYLSRLASRGLGDWMADNQMEFPILAPNDLCMKWLVKIGTLEPLDSDACSTVASNRKNKQL